MFFKTIIDRPLPAELETFTEQMDQIEARDKHIQWKIKAMACKITYRMFTKYGNPKTVNEAFEIFSQRFLEAMAVPLLESHLQLVFKRKQNFVGSKALNFALKYVSSSTKQEKTMDVLRPFVENLLYETVIPIMLISHKDVSLFKEDPIEYIRKQNDFAETCFAHKNTGVDMMTYLCTYTLKKTKKKAPVYLHKFLEFCVNNLGQYQMQTNPDWRIKEAILLAIGSLYEPIMDRKDLKSMMEPMFITHVLPELQSPQPFLRLRACWLYGEFGEFKFLD